MTDTSNDAIALRTFLINLLTEIPTELLATQEGRDQVVESYEVQAATSHPAVASALRDAAAIVRNGWVKPKEAG